MARRSLLSVAAAGVVLWPWDAVFADSRVPGFLLERSATKGTPATGASHAVEAAQAVEVTQAVEVAQAVEIGRAAEPTRAAAATWQRRMPPTPSFPATIDAYARYQGGTTCSPTNKLGPAALKNIVIETYGNRAWSIARPCSSSSINEHKEGRALDVAFNAFNASSRKNANDFLYWLLRPDVHGNRHAFARRLGIMYVIWNRKMWRAYRPDAGWLWYTGSNPHTDHIHLSFSWAGARRETTWWTLR
ncbi:hypothetical protein [Actinopolymorpha sp. B9G3]|uniref:hypothetical protein n=1 Tax=Actinopolymorpha sp. B9G3 TaxID=3158970 RepID=UPI0032D8F3F9